MVLRAKIVLLSAAGRLNKDIAVELATARKTVAHWRNRFVQKQRSAECRQIAPSNAISNADFIVFKFN